MSNYVQLAEEHWDWLEPILELQHRHHMALMRRLCLDEFIHGYKHGKEDLHPPLEEAKK